MSDPEPGSDVDVLVVGAGPTGLTLALELGAQGVDVAVVDAAPDPVHESRAIVVQARTLEVLARHGIADHLVAAGERAAGLLVHGRGRAAQINLVDDGIIETTYPFLLFLSQAETERVLLSRLARDGLTVRRDSTVVGVEQGSEHVTCTIRGEEGTSQIRARYVVGCDGAHSAVRVAAGLAFAGTTYPQTFVISDLEANGIAPGRLNVFLGDTGLVFFFPLGRPATWRALTMRPAGSDEETTLAGLQRVVAAQTGGQVVVRDPVWLTDFSISERCVDRLRHGRVLLAGDAAHIHSPAGGQGMNTGIQDAVNLGWKLALVCRGEAGEALLDSYADERLPVARGVLRTTGRAFRLATSSRAPLRALRPRVATAVLPLLTRVPAIRRAAFRALAELDVGYRNGPLSIEAAVGTRSPGRTRLRPGDRVPDGPVVVDGRPLRLQQSLSPTAFTLLLCGPGDHWSTPAVRALESRWPGMVRARQLNASEGLRQGMGLDPRRSTQLLVRPDGYLGHRVDAADLSAVDDYLRTVLGGSSRDGNIGVRA